MGNIDCTRSLFVSLVGRPNVGKSSIMNMLINSKVSIVSPKPQTTRSRIRGIFTDKNVQLVFIDTPGLHKPWNRLGDYMTAQVDQSLNGAEACLHVVEPNNLISETDLSLIKKFNKLKLQVILVINKIDTLKNKSEIIKYMEEFNKLFNYVSIIPISAKTGEGKKELIEEIKKLSKPSVFFFPKEDITDQTEKVLAGEIIREKLLLFLDKELPHGTAVFIEYFKEKNSGTRDISATIYCERKSHKGMIIGSGGKMIKKIGTESRKALEELLGYKVNLNLFVKVKEDWRDKEYILRDLGYMDN